jgi:hypothetical protein
MNPHHRREEEGVGELARSPHLNGEITESAEGRRGSQFGAGIILADRAPFEPLPSPVRRPRSARESSYFIANGDTS